MANHTYPGTKLPSTIFFKASLRPSKFVKRLSIASAKAPVGASTLRAAFNVEKTNRILKSPPSAMRSFGSKKDAVS